MSVGCILVVFTNLYFELKKSIFLESLPKSYKAAAAVPLQTWIGAERVPGS